MIIVLQIYFSVYVISVVRKKHADLISAPIILNKKNKLKIYTVMKDEQFFFLMYCHFCI